VGPVYPHPAYVYVHPRPVLPYVYAPGYVYRGPYWGPYWRRPYAYRYHVRPRYWR